MSEVPISWFLMLSAVIFALGVAGFLFRRNIITVFMSIELMLNAVNLTFVTFSYQLKQVNGHLFAFFVMRANRDRENYIESANDHERFIDSLTALDTSELREIVKDSMSQWKEDMLSRLFPETAKE